MRRNLTIVAAAVTFVLFMFSDAAFAACGKHEKKHAEKSGNATEAAQYGTKGRVRDGGLRHKDCTGSFKEGLEKHTHGDKIKGGKKRCG